MPAAAPFYCRSQHPNIQRIYAAACIGANLEIPARSQHRPRNAAAHSAEFLVGYFVGQLARYILLL